VSNPHEVTELQAEVAELSAQVDDLKKRITLIGKFNKEGANDLRIASQVTFALMPD
jgi:hypothetical protein